MWLNNNELRSSPKAAGLKTCLSDNLRKFLDAMAAIPASVMSYQGRLGSARSAIINAVTKAAEGKKRFFSRSFRKMRSDPTVAISAIKSVTIGVKDWV